MNLRMLIVLPVSPRNHFYGSSNGRTFSGILSYGAETVLWQPLQNEQWAHNWQGCSTGMLTMRRLESLADQKKNSEKTGSAQTHMRAYSQYCQVVNPPKYDYCLHRFNTSFFFFTQKLQEVANEMQLPEVTCLLTYWVQSINLIYVHFQISNGIISKTGGKFTTVVRLDQFWIPVHLVLSPWSQTEKLWRKHQPTPSSIEISLGPPNLATQTPLFNSRFHSKSLLAPSGHCDPKYP